MSLPVPCAPNQRSCSRWQHQEGGGGGGRRSLFQLSQGEGRVRPGPLIRIHLQIKRTKQLSSAACLEAATGMLTVTDETLGFACDANVPPQPEVSSSWLVPESVLFSSRVTALAGNGRERLCFRLIGCERHLYRSSGVLSSY